MKVEFFLLKCAHLRQPFDVGASVKIKRGVSYTFVSKKMLPVLLYESIYEMNNSDLFTSKDTDYMNERTFQDWYFY